jgi:hypothetical protein
MENSMADLNIPVGITINDKAIATGYIPVQTDVMPTPCGVAVEVLISTNVKKDLAALLRQIADGIDPPGEPLRVEWQEWSLSTEN